MYLKIQPILKWPGGKRWFIQQYSNYLPKNFNRYIEPFLGAGSVFFHYKTSNALLGDINPDVVDVYNAIKHDWNGVIEYLKLHQAKHSQDYYYHIRDCQPDDLIEAASRTIYLNRTCFNGIYRVNKKGKFNVPIGTRDKILPDLNNFEAISKILQETEIRLSDFKPLIDEARFDDLIFADPPYTIRHNLNGFVKYNEVLFSWSDQERLANSLIQAKKKGVKIVSTNANHSSIMELYEGHGFNFQVVSRFSPISASGSNRKQFEEIIITANL